jgi:hypothetical protein
MKRWWLCTAAAISVIAVGCGASEATSATGPSTAAAHGHHEAHGAGKGHGKGGCGCGMEKGGMAAHAGHDGGSGCGHAEGKLGRGRGHGVDRGGMGPVAGDPSHRQDMQGFHYLLDHRGQIRREVTNLSDGVSTVTESDDPEVAQRLREHVQAMHLRLRESRPIHARDPLFAAIFRSAEAITLTIEPTPKGVRVVETSKDPAVVLLIQAHAAVISAFLEKGHTEMRRDHPVPSPAP